MFNLFPALLFDADGGGAGGGTGDPIKVDPPTDPPEPGDPLQDLRKQVEGVESLLGSHKKEFGDMRTEFKTNNDLLNNVLSQLQGGAAPGDPAPAADDSQYNFMTKADVDAQLAANTQQILDALTKGSQQNNMATKYNLDNDAMNELDAFAKENNIGSNLEAAYLLKLKNEGKLNPQGGATPNEIVQTMANRNGVDVVPEAGGGQDNFDDPFKWLSTPPDSPEYTNDIRRFEDWRIANPKEFKRLMREKTVATHGA